MKPFHTIAVPHKDILEGRLTMDVYAADLWEVHKKRGHEEYLDPDIFFRKTFLTKGLTNLFGVVENRIKGKGGDAVIQLQTPFGGGKTHSLIALYHKAGEWKAKRIVIVGTSLNPKTDTLWGLMEEQLTGKVDKFKGNVSPGKEDIRALLEKNQPLLILMDEVLEYVTKAAGVTVGDTTLAAQTIAFMQEFTEAVSTVEKSCIIITLPSSIIEHYDESAENLFQKLQKVTGRLEKVYTPVEDDEITSVVSKRLFSRIDEAAAKHVVTEVVDYFRRESMFPPGVEPSEYRAKFLLSYPFQPDVIECFYHRWGSFPTFQRTRGVLRLLSCIIYSLKDENVPYITLANIDLANQEIRRELLKHIGNEFDSVVAKDITDKNSGAREVDKSLGESYKGLSLGTRSATTIFLYSFSGGHDRGATINEIKRSASILSIPSSAVSEAVDLMRDRLFYVQHQGGKEFFTNKPNLNRILLTKIENIDEKEVREIEIERLKAATKDGKLKTYIWPTQSNDIADDSDLKLIVLKEKNIEAMRSIIETKGVTPRVFRNTIFFLTPLDIKKNELFLSIKRKIALEQIEADKTLKLSDEEKKIIKGSVKKEEENVQSKIRESYRMLYIPSKNTFEEKDLGVPTYGFASNLIGEVYDKLKSEGTVIERMVPLVIKEKFLKDKKYVSTKQIFENSQKTLGEHRITSKSVLEESLREGVRQGVFGLGELSEGKLIPVYWKKEPTVGFTENEVLIQSDICIEELEKAQTKAVKEIPEEPYGGEGAKPPAPVVKDESIQKLDLPPMRIPKGKVSQLLGLLNYMQTKYDKIEVKISASEGSMKKEEFENKIKEALRQMGIEV